MRALGLPPISGLECVNTLRRMGFMMTTSGDTLIGLRRGHRVVVVPLHEALTEVQLRLVLARAGVSMDDFLWFHEPASWRHIGMAVEPPPSSREAPVK